MIKGETQIEFKKLLLALFILAIPGTQYLISHLNLGMPHVVQELIVSPELISPEKENYALLVSPQIVMPGDTLRILVTSEVNIEDASISLKGPSGDLSAARMRSGGGPPFWWSAEFKTLQEGTYTVSLGKKKKNLISRELIVPTPKPSKNKSPAIWDVESEWTRATENLYSAWVDALFHDADERSSWKALHEATQDPQKNILHNHLGLGEDNPGEKNSIDMEPDCADAPFFLRAYFAWKMRLPFGFHECTRGYLQRAPECKGWLSNGSKRGKGNETQVFNNFLRVIMNTIHSGTARTSLEAENSDYYPVPLTRNDLRPGVVFADPYGHTLVLVRWLPQTAKQSGQLFAVDAQPDGTIGIRRFWRGNFLFATKEVIGDPGFKAFRPIIQEKSRLRPMTNDEIAESVDYANFSLQQKNMESDEFYNTMDSLINPEPLDPASAFHDLFVALHEQLVVRVLSVSNGENYIKTHPGTTIPMPSGAAAVFQDVGLWEDYSTPNRDMRLLIAMDTVLEFPEKVAKSPQAYKFPKRKTPEQVKKELEELQKKWAQELTIAYTRSNGTQQTLTIAEILKRKEGFEMAYNPNDCIEVRWGAVEGSQELSTCGRRAPAFQQERMKSLRHWFHKRLRPPT